MHIDKQADRQADGRTDRQRDIETDRYTNTDTDIYTDRRSSTNSSAKWKKETQKSRDRETEIGHLITEIEFHRQLSRIPPEKD